jgi:hypothetical protein
MINVFKRLVWRWQVHRAIRRADRMHQRYGLRFMVIYMNGSLRVVPRRAMRVLIAKHRFRRGVTIADIDRSALYITN